MKVEVAIGEVLDKLTILDIKLDKISDPLRRDSISKEKQVLKDALKENDIALDIDLYNELRSINMKIWDTEAGFRKKESQKCFDDEFIKYARLNAQYNDERFLAKKRINIHYNSSIQEEKSYDFLYGTNN